MSTSSASSVRRASSDEIVENGGKKPSKLCCGSNRMCTICAPQGSKLKLLTLCGVLSFATNFPEGYCNSYPNTSHNTFQKSINDSYIARGMEGGLSTSFFTWYWSGMLNVWFLGYLVGTFLTPYCTDNFGRKKALFFANCVALLGALLSLFGVVLAVPELFFISRIVASISSGISFGSLILFLQEATPTEHRGVTSFLSESTFIATTALGIGCGMDVVFGKNLALLTGVSIIPAVVGMLIVLPLHETPKFLLINRGDRAAALRSLEFYRGVNDEQNDEVLEEMMLEMQSSCPDDEKVSIWEGIKEVFTEGHLRLSFLMGAASLQIIVGIWPIVYLSTDLLEKNFSEEISQIASFAFIMADFLASLAGMYIIERMPRRKLLLGMGVANTLSLCLFIAADLLIPVWDPIRWGQIVALILFGMTYGMALGPIAFFITSELVPQRSRSIVQSMVFGFNTIMNFAFSFVTLPLYDALGPLSFLPLLVVPSSACLLFLYRYLPETRGREVHDVVYELMERHNKPAFEARQRMERNLKDSVQQLAPEHLSVDGGSKKRTPATSVSSEISQ